MEKTPSVFHASEFIDTSNHLKSQFRFLWWQISTDTLHRNKIPWGPQWCLRTCWESEISAKSGFKSRWPAMMGGENTPQAPETPSSRNPPDPKVPEAPEGPQPPSAPSFRNPSDSRPPDPLKPRGSPGSKAPSPRVSPSPNVPQPSRPHHWSGAAETLWIPKSGVFCHWVCVRGGVWYHYFLVGICASLHDQMNLAKPELSDLFFVCLFQYIKETYI